MVPAECRVEEVGLPPGECLRLQTSAGQQPYFDLLLRVSNHSPLPFIIDRILLEARVEEPIGECAYLRRTTLKVGQTLEQLRVRYYLTGAQAGIIRDEWLNSDGRARAVRLQAGFYVDCRLGAFATERRLEVPTARIKNANGHKEDS